MWAVQCKVFTMRQCQVRIDHSIQQASKKDAYAENFRKSKEDVAKIEKDLNMYTGLTQITKSGKSMKIINYLILLLQ